MSLPSLVLWLLVFPMAALWGLLAGLGAYFLARPRVRDDGGAVGLQRDLLVESWRLAALVAAVPAAVLAMELALWGLYFEHRVALAYTGVAQWLGLVLMALAPIPLVRAALRREAFMGRPARLAGGLLLTGLLLFPLGWWLRAEAWRAQQTAALAGEAGVREVLALKGYRFVTAPEATAVLNRALPATPDLLALLDRARTPGGPALDGELAEYFTDRLERALRAAEPAVTTQPELAAVPAIWWLTGDGERALRAYALSVAEFRDSARASAEMDFQSLLADGLGRGSPGVATALLEAAQPLAARVPLRPELIEALVRRANGPGAGAELAQAMLLRDASAAALRPLMPRFARADDPAWQLVRADCPERTPGFKALTADPDPEVAGGARAVLAYVRQYCVTSRRVGQ